MDIVYSMPNMANRLFVNVIHACPNSCRFCIDYVPGKFFGFELRRGRSATVESILGRVLGHPNIESIDEIYFCGIGEPLLMYDVVVESAGALRTALGRRVLLGINTSGTYYKMTSRVDFAKWFDLVQVSLNAENEEKYVQICRPKFDGAFGTVMAFLSELKSQIEQNDWTCRVELSAVDVSETDFLPQSQTVDWEPVVPDFEECAKIAKSFGWSFKVKTLIRESGDSKWERPASQLMSI